MFGISSFARLGLNPWKNWSITVLAVTYNSLFNSHVLDPQAEPITQVRPAECLNNPCAMYYFFKKLVWIPAIKSLQWTVLAALAGNQIHLCAKGRVSSTGSAETLVELSLLPSYSLLFLPQATWWGTTLDERNPLIVSQLKVWNPCHWFQMDQESEQSPKYLPLMITWLRIHLEVSWVLYQRV